MRAEKRKCQKRTGEKLEIRKRSRGRIRLYKERAAHREGVEAIVISQC